ncbi:MAG TPA: DUF2934 domain-containing protein [Candidatus Sulfotelmatobacter sp.]
MARPKSPNGGKRKNDTSISNSTLTAPVTPTSAATDTVKTEPVKSQPLPAEVTRETLRLEVMKNDSRASVVPINLEDEIRRRAYELSERRGFIPGYEAEDWLAAEHEVLRRYRQQSA